MNTTREFFLNYARKGTTAALAAALPVLAVSVANVTSDGTVSTGEIVVAVGAVAASACAAFGLVFKAANR